MFALAAISISDKHRASEAHLLAEVVATLGLLLVIFSLARTRRGSLAPAAVGAYIGAAYFFTSSTSFANPAITVGRMFSDTFAGIAPAAVPAFIGAQLVGGPGRRGRDPRALPGYHPRGGCGGGGASRRLRCRCSQAVAGGVTMKKLVIAGGAIAAATVIAKRWTATGGLDFGRMVEHMPDDAPPKWMFRNITAIRENTDRILELLQSERRPVGAP